MSCRALAVRNGHEEIVRWIDKGLAPVKLGRELDKCNATFVEGLLTGLPVDELEQLLKDAQSMVSGLEAASAQTQMVSALERNLYVLDKCWATQAKMGFRAVYHLKLSGLQSGLSRELEGKVRCPNSCAFAKYLCCSKFQGLLQCLARLGQATSLGWLLDTKRVAVGSELVIQALYLAIQAEAQLNPFDVVKALVSRGVDPSSSPLGETNNLLWHAVSNLHADIVRYLLDGHHFSRHHLTSELRAATIAHCVYTYIEQENGTCNQAKCQEIVQQKAENRLEILKFLTTKGLRLQDHDEHEREFLSEVLQKIRLGDLSDQLHTPPFTEALVQWLCGQGLDLVTAFEKSYLGSGTPDWLQHMVKAAKSTWPVADAVARGAPADELELLLEKCEIDVLSIKSRNGSTLLQLAGAGGKVDVVEFLVKRKGADLDERDATGNTIFDNASKLGLTDMEDKIRWLRKWQKKNKKKAEAQKKKMQQYVLVVQRSFRCHVARTILGKKRKLQSIGIWSDVVSQVANLEQRHDQHPDFAKPWVVLKVELDLVIQNEFDDSDVQAELLIDPSSMPLEGALQKRDDGADHTEEQGEQGSEKVFVYSIQLTTDALRWVRKQKDEKYRALFVSRLEQLASGDRSYCLSKHLKGDSKRPDIIETKLDAGQRILWTERGDNILVWFVAKHKSVSHCVGMITRSYDRLASTKKQLVIQASSGAINAGQREQDEPEVLVEPSANVPLKIHTVHHTLLGQLVSDSTWTPPLKLTATEEEIVNRDGSVLLLGRSGTGKTLCVCNRMARDRQRFGKELRQLFVARTQRLCDYVQALQQKAGEDVQSARFIRMDTMVSELAETHARNGMDWSDQTRVDYQRFRDTIWSEIAGNERQSIDVLVVWTQIRSFIKGSVEAAQQCRPLEAGQYVNELSKKRCRLDVAMRESCHKIFVRYQSMLDRNGWWDEMDRCSLIMGSMWKESSKLKSPLYDRVYVDEVQDATQAEIGLLLLMLGGQSDALFLAGDTAQAVTQGVDFRFEEVRSAVHLLSAGKQRVPREERLSRNFRSHEGILSVANLVLDRMHSFFPNAAAKLAPDTGLVTGPRPGLLLTNGYEPVRQILRANNKLRVLTRDEVAVEVRAKLNGEGRMGDTGGDSGSGGVEAAAPPSYGLQVFGIREAKGLEFSDVLLVDFFASSGCHRGIAGSANDSAAELAQQRAQHKSWKLLLAAVPTAEPSRHSLPLEMELELKLLYTAITRSCNRLFFIETQKTPSGEAWFRRLHEAGLANPLSHCDTAQLFSESRAMTADDWRVEGIEAASLAEGCAVDTADTALQRAVACFRNASDTMLLHRAEAHLRGTCNERQARTALLQMSSPGASVQSQCKQCRTSQASLLCSSCKCVSYCSIDCQRADWKHHKAEEKCAVDAICGYLEAGLFREAAACCRLFCKEERLTRLATRIERLGSAPSNVNQHQHQGGGAGAGYADVD
jgi:ankyrin repeat protein